jgi:hypothetical protein
MVWITGACASCGVFTLVSEEGRLCSTCLDKPAEPEEKHEQDLLFGFPTGMPGQLPLRQN